MPESPPSKPWPQVPAVTGDDAVDSLLRGALPPLATEPVAEHAAAYEQLHRELLGALNAESASRPGLPPGGHQPAGR